ncbi:MAG: SDR family oxidoreductase [Myxococcales bacterium]|nr:SDR family oxidoreductase [Myxococcales bacterium]
MSAHSNLVALVTGANRGLGLETSRQLAAEGVTVIMAGRDSKATHAAAEQLASEGFKVLPAVLDVNDDGQIENLRARIEREFGKLDILINNAGVIFDGSFFGNNATEVTKDIMRRTFEVNLFAPIALTQALLPLIKAAPAGRIVNLSSVLGSLAMQADPNSFVAPIKPLAYNASKAALNMFTIELAAALAGTNVKVNSAHPGWVKTDLGGAEAPMEIVDGAKTSVALALAGADGPNGAFIHMGEALPW